MRRIAIGRIIGLLLAIIGIGVSVWYARESLRMNAEFHQWIGARPMETAIDLSQPGETTVPFHQTCCISHGEAVYLKCDLNGDSQQELEELLKELSADMTITDSDGNEIEEIEINSRTVRYWDGRVVLAEFAPFRNGDYVATIRIDSGVPALAGKQQTIYAKYHLCGLERMPVMLAGAFAVGAGIVGLISAVCVLPGLLRSGVYRDVPTDDLSQVNTCRPRNGKAVQP